MNVNTSSNYAYVAGLFLLFSSLVGVLFSSVIYYKYQGATYYITITKPFAQYYQYIDLYNSVNTVGDAVKLNATVLDKAWCNLPTGDYTLHPQTRSPSCTCLNNYYAQFMYDILAPLINNSNTSLNLQSWIQKPWVLDPASPSIFYSYVNSSVAVARTKSSYYGTASRACRTSRSTWRIDPYPFRLHPLALFFYTSFTMFIFGFSYLSRVESLSHTGSWSKYLLLGFSAAAILFLVLIDAAGNWFYALGIGCVCFNYLTSITDEFQSMVDKEQKPLVEHSFVVPHPLMVGLWNYMIIFVPILIVYMGLVNYVRDIVALFGLYVLGYMLTACVQRYFWSKWYMQANMVIESFQMSYKHMDYTLTKESARLFRVPILIFLAVIFVVMLAFTSTTLFVNWYSETFLTGAWTSLAVASVLLIVFVIEFFTRSEEFLHFGFMQFIQVMLVILCNCALVSVAAYDSTL